MIKYANNPFLASTVSLINDIRNICKEFDVDTRLPTRSGSMTASAHSYFARGSGGGGSRSGKDVAAISSVARGRGYDDVLQIRLRCPPASPCKVANSMICRRAGSAC
jgi:UDP-glucose 6-dehydrogenase